MAGESRDDVQDALVERLVPQPLALFTTKDRCQTIPKPQGASHGSFLQGRHIAATRGVSGHGPGGWGEFDLVEIDGGHETLFTRPKAVAEALIKAVS